MWKPNPARMQTPSSSSTFWWCRPFAVPEQSVCNSARRPPLPAWRQKAQLK